MFRTSRFFAATILSLSNASAAAVLCLIAGVLLTGCDKSETQLANRNAAGDENKGSIERTSEGVISSGSANSSVAIERSPVDPKNITVDEQGYVKLGDPEPIPASTGDAPSKDTVLNASGMPTPAAPETPTQQPTPAELTLSATDGSQNTNNKSETNKAENTPAVLSLNGSTPGSVVANPASTNIPSGKGDRSETVAPSKPHDPESGLATFDEKNQLIAKDWPKPQALLFFTGQQHGYIEPCGCTGLENQKGGLNRRDTLLGQFRDRGWDVVPMDVGNFERRLGRQAEIKLQTTVDALKEMQYRAVTLGEDDLRLSSAHLLSLTATEGKTETPFVSANAYVLIEEYMSKYKIIEVGGRKIGVTAVLGDEFREKLKSNDEIITMPAAESLKPVLAKLKKECDYTVLLAHTTLEESQALAKEVQGFDLIVTSGGYPEPPFQLETVQGSDSKLAQVGAKGMYAVVVGLYADKDQPVRYQRIALSSQFNDSPRMLDRFAQYQKQLETLGLSGLGVREAIHPSGRQFVGSEKCGDCHTKAFEVWKNSEHFTATESLVKPPNDRSAIPRHFDPECLSCHVTGWNPQNYYPYATGFTSLQATPLLTGNGCENCHGPGSAHVAAENGDVQADQAMLKQLQEQMRLPLAEARQRCLECHDHDNSPEFGHEGAFEEYWKQIAHSGKD